MECPRCHRRNPRDARFCEECGARLMLRCAQCGTEFAAGAKFCLECGQPVSPPAPAARYAGPGSSPPTHVAEKLFPSREALEGERKQVTVLFADMKGSMESLAGRDPEEARQILDPVLEMMMGAVHRYEGTVNQVMGDGIMALFGAPIALEDHAVRACYAALRMREVVAHYAEQARRAHDVDVQIRVGLNSGEVVVRAIDSDLRVDYTAVGQTTHLAARMEQLASPGSILLTAGTLALSAGHIEVKPLGRVSVKGLAEPVEVHELTGTARARTRWEARATRGLGRFIGRDAEMGELRRALERARTGGGQIVTVVGEPGVGKSRLFSELVHSGDVRGWLPLECGCVSYGRNAAYLPVIQLLRAYFHLGPRDDGRRVPERVTETLLALDRSLEPTVPALLALLDVAIEDPHWQPLGPAQRRERILDAVTGLLLRESERQPLLLVFEDLHWCDAETQAVLDSLVERLPRARILLLANYRPEYRHSWRREKVYTELTLDPLQPETAAALLDALLGEDPGLQSLKQFLISRTGGNPLFLEESVRALIETGALGGERGARRLTGSLDAVRVPATVQAILAARIDRLPPDEKRLLQSAAVIGKDVPLALLHAVADVPERALGRHLANLRAAEFLYETARSADREYAFKHALTHEVAYNSLLHDRRTTLHARIVGAIERLYAGRLPEHVERLAHHAARGEQWAKAVNYLRQSGTRAFAKGSVEESLDRYEQALALVERLPEGHERTRVAIDLRLDLHVPLIVLGRVSRLGQLHAESEALARQLDDPLRLGRVLYRRGQSAWMEGRYREGLRYAGQALETARAVGDPELRVLTTYISGISHHALGQYRAAIDHLVRVVEGPDAEIARRALALTVPAFVGAAGWLGHCLTLVGDLDRALVWTERAIEAADALDHPQAQVVAYTLHAIPLGYRGEAASAVAVSQRAVDLCLSKALVVWLPAAASTLGWALVVSGRPADGVPHIERGVGILESIGLRTHLARMYVWLAEGCLAGGRLEDAERHARRALELSEACEERGHEAEARVVEAALSAAGAPDGPDTAIARFEAARALGEELGMRPLVARCHLEVGRLHRGAGRGAPAERHLRLAQELFHAMGMRAWAEEAERWLGAGR